MSGTILVIDDDEANLELVERRLEVEGFDTALCETGHSGLERALAEPFDAVLLDLRLPDINGMEVLEVLRRERPALPVLIMTAHGSEAIAVKALTAGAAGYLIKPISRRELNEAVHSAVGAAARRAAEPPSPLSPAALADRLDALLEAMADGAVLVAADGRIEAANAVALALLRLETAPDTYDGLWAPAEVLDEAGESTPAPVAACAAEQPISLTLRFGDGGEAALVVDARPINGGGYVLKLRDETERRTRRARLESLLAEQAAALSEAQSRLQTEAEVAQASVERMKRSLLSTVSHELRTPLNFIVGFGSVLADGVLGDLTPEQGALLGKMLFGAERLTEMVEELLDAAMLAAGMLAPHCQAVAIAPLAEAAVEQARPRAEAAGLSLVYEPGAAPTARADAEYVAKVLRQLLDNALKFTGPGGRVAVKAEPHPETGEPSIVVEDTGPGIAREDVPRLYERFVQLDSSQTRRYGGFGLGLSTAKGLAESMGGRLELESELGRGSRFRLVVPAEGR